ncbi:SDR family oxidoreductase [Histidinibacterium lentulum]|uniref:SDR family oxidoreductase n=1 Tax=Histidinibacterium lentulum TaxID=2480588 RepID=UPI001FE765C5|nr:SDR family oxidoreductase [Histidinibacterium lentulum]
MDQLHGKTAIVCGGSAGVGRATVDALVARGCRVGVIARGEDRLEEIARAYGPGEGGLPRIVTASVDVSDHEALEKAADALAAELGTPEIWVNCAMLTSFSPFREVEPAEFERIVAVTFLGQVNGCRAALRLMTRGAIVNVGSGLAYRSVPFQSAYVASKHAINGFTGSLRSELIREGRDITLSLVQLPSIDTPQFDWARNRLPRQPKPAEPVYSPEVAADAILRAALEGPRELLVGNTVLKLSAGQAVAPDWLDHKLAADGAEAQMSDRPEEGPRQDNLADPAPYPASASGSYGHLAADRALVIDGDRARWTALGGIALTGFALGLALGLPKRR